MQNCNANELEEFQCKLSKGVIFCSNCQARFNAAISNDKYEESFCIQGNSICDNSLCNCCFRIKVNNISNSTVRNKKPVSIANEKENSYTFFLEQLKKENKTSQMQRQTNQILITKHDRSWSIQQD